MQNQVPSTELQSRMSRFREQMSTANPDWQIAVIVSKINLYYFTGTMQEGMLWIPRNDDAIFWVRRSFERALMESAFTTIKPMNSFRDAAANIGKLPTHVYLETEAVPLAFYQRFQKYFPFEGTKPLDPQVAYTRAVKSSFELSLMERSGKIHQKVLETTVPQILEEGISEASFATRLFAEMVKEGHQGISRFAMYDTEMVLGHIGFGESSIYPTSFNGPGGNYGVGPAVPSLGSSTRKLKKGDLVFVDVGCGVQGYHTDKTVTYMFGTPLPDYAIEMHQRCVAIQHQIASMLRPGNIPSQIYDTIINSLDDKFLKNFMGYGNRQVKFLGHGIGLTIDELPVLAQGFDEPLQEGMVFAVEPKKGIEGIGMVGIENTFVVTPQGGRCITGNSPGLIPVNC